MKISQQLHKSATHKAGSDPNCPTCKAPPPTVGFPGREYEVTVSRTRIEVASFSVSAKDEEGAEEKVRKQLETAGDPDKVFQETI